MIVTIGNTKGGVGKTTLTFQLAVARRRAGRDVLLVDADSQGSAQSAATLRAEADRSPSLSCVQLADGRLLRAQLAALAAKHDDTLIDVGGRDSAALRAALARSDLLVVPVQPRAVDVWALSDIADLIEQAQAARADDSKPALRVLAVLNLADPGTNQDTVEAAAALAEFPQLPVVEVVIRRRKAVANAMAHGLSVAELTPRDPKACEEIAALVSNVFDVHEVQNGDHKGSQAEQGRGL
jgi:chromosome partitioning protein